MSSTTCRTTKEFPQAMMALSSFEVDDTQSTTTTSSKTSKCTPPLALDTSMHALTSVPAKDGRQAYRALCAHYQGRQTHNSLADAAMSTLSSTNFDGRKFGLTLESYCHKMRKAVNNRTRGSILVLQSSSSLMRSPTRICRPLSRLSATTLR